MKANTLGELVKAIARERDYQASKWGKKPRTVQAWLLVIRAELEEAITGWVKTGDDSEALTELLQVAACAVSCIMEHGIYERKKYIGE